MSVRPHALCLNEMYAGFVQSGVSIIAASRDAQNRPLVTRAVGCRMSADRRRVTIFLPRPRASAIIAAVEQGAPLAAVFTLPSTHHSIQLKAASAEVSPLEKRDRDIIERYSADWVREVTPLGFRPELVGALVACAGEEVVAVTFTPDCAFQQTPGPTAGIPLQQ
jgi:hypothetical protein